VDISVFNYALSSVWRGFRLVGGFVGVVAAACDLVGGVGGGVGGVVVVVVVFMNGQTYY
jgi:hypothetical protein